MTLWYYNVDLRDVHDWNQTIIFCFWFTNIPFSVLVSVSSIFFLVFWFSSQSLIVTVWWYSGQKQIQRERFVFFFLLLWLFIQKLIKFIMYWSIFCSSCALQVQPFRDSIAGNIFNLVHMWKLHRWEKRETSTHIPHFQLVNSLRFIHAFINLILTSNLVAIILFLYLSSFSRKHGGLSFCIVANFISHTHTNKYPLHSSIFFVKRFYTWNISFNSLFQQRTRNISLYGIGVLHPVFVSRRHAFLSVFRFCLVSASLSTFSSFLFWQKNLEEIFLHLTIGTEVEEIWPVLEKNQNEKKKITILILIFEDSILGGSNKEVHNF